MSNIKDCCDIANFHEFRQCDLCSRCNQIICPECGNNCENINCKKMVCGECNYCGKCKVLESKVFHFTKIKDNTREIIEPLLIVNNYCVYNDSFKIEKKLKTFLPEEFYLYIPELNQEWFLIRYDNNTKIIKLQRNGSLSNLINNGLDYPLFIK